MPDSRAWMRSPDHLLTEPPRWPALTARANRAPTSWRQPDSKENMLHRSRYGCSAAAVSVSREWVIGQPRPENNFRRARTTSLTAFTTGGRTLYGTIAHRASKGRLQSTSPGQTQLRVDVNDVDACRDGFAKVRIVSAGTSMQSQSNRSGLLYLSDSHGVETLPLRTFHQAREHTMLVSDGGRQNVDARGLNVLPCLERAREHPVWLVGRRVNFRT